MLLIIFLGLIAKLALVSADCDVGTKDVNDFDFNQITGPRPWYGLLHTPNKIANSVDCFVATYARPEGNRSLITVGMYNISAKSHVTIYGYATNWSSTGYWDVDFQPATFFNGRIYAIAVDYDRYVIGKHCTNESNKPYIYVGYRSQHPEEETVEEVKKKLQENNIDGSHLVEFPVDHC